MLKKLLKRIAIKLIRITPSRIWQFAYNQTQHGYSGKDHSKVDLLIKESISASNACNYDVAESLLREAALINKSSTTIMPHLSRVRFLKERSLNNTSELQTQIMIETINQMNRELKSGRDIYVPSEFWDTFGKFHIQLLEKYGIENFKRTVSHNYQNWYMINKDDPQVIQLLKTWETNYSIEPWLNIIEVPDHVGLHTDINFDHPVYPLADAQNREVYRISVGLLWEYVNVNDNFDILEKLQESEIGNPIRIWRKGQIISSDIAHSVRERNLLLNNLSLTGNEGFIVGELGAGHGRLAEVFGRTTNYRHFIFDITPALYVSQWYIKSIFPNEKIFEFRQFENFDEIRQELSECRFAFFTANQIEKLPAEYVQLFINMNSLTEMRIDQISNFLFQIDRVTSLAFLSRQWLKWENPLDRHSVSTDTFKMNENWRLNLDKIDDIYPEFFNQIWIK
jgi:putative sugar O-methyltransferase